MGNFSRFGFDAAGNVAETVIIPAVAVPLSSRLMVTDLEVAARTTSANTRVSLQRSVDGGVTFTNQLNVELPANGTLHTALGSPIPFISGATVATQAQVRVVFQQGVIGPIGSTISGRTFGPRQQSGADL